MVCDGASSNLSLLKVLSEYKGRRLPLEAGDGVAKFLPTMKFINPYDPYKDDSEVFMICLLYTSPSPRDGLLSRMPSSA